MSGPTATGAASAIEDPILAAFAEEVGSAGPVCVAGGRTQWEVGGPPVAGTRVLAAPRGVVMHQPDEMIVRVRTGTPVAELSEVLAATGQMVPLDPPAPERATVGGVLSVGRSGWRRLRYGPVRDALLEARFVSSEGHLVKAGGPVVKNVTGFDLCRLLVGSLGTLGLLAEVVLRCTPRPRRSQWFRGVGADPFAVATRLYRSSCLLWDGTDTWVLLEGEPVDVDAQAASVLGSAFAEVAHPPAAPGPGRVSVAPSQLHRLAGSSTGFLAEIGVGVVHAHDPGAIAASLDLAWPPRPTDDVAALDRAVKTRFDPSGRLNPGRVP